MCYKQMQVKSGLTELKRKIPYGWDLNIYRGCEHSCCYCYAMYSHKYLGEDDFFNDIYVKTNIVEELEKELKSDNWKKEIVNIGGVTDSYQPAEAQYKLMPDILKLMIKYKTPIIISTKSDLILRDYNLIEELSKITYVNIASTITTTDENIRQKIEPKSSPTIERFKFLKEFRNTNASVGVHVMPIIPYITDNERNIDEICASTREIGAHYLLPGTLYLRGNTREYFFEFLQKEFPEKYDYLLKLYPKGAADSGYKDKLYEMVNRITSKYDISRSYMKVMREKLK